MNPCFVTVWTKLWVTLSSRERADSGAGWYTSRMGQYTTECHTKHRKGKALPEPPDSVMPAFLPHDQLTDVTYSWSYHSTAKSQGQNWHRADTVHDEQESVEVKWLVTSFVNEHCLRAAYIGAHSLQAAKYDRGSLFARHCSTWNGTFLGVKVFHRYTCAAEP